MKNRIRQFLTSVFVLASVLTFTLIQAETSKNHHENRASAESLTHEAEKFLDQWRGQTELLEQAAEKLSLALKQDPEYPKAYMQLGRYYMMAGYYHSRYFEPGSLPASEAAIHKAIALDPQFADAYVLLGHLYTNMNRIPEAKKALTTAERIGTNSPWLKLNLAEIYDREKRYDEAVPLYIDVINSGTKNIKALGQAYDELRAYYVWKKDVSKAEKIYQAHITLEPKNAWVRGNYAANLLYQIGDFNGAIAKARDALAIMNYGNARYTLALALYGKWATVLTKEGNKQRAQPYFDEARNLYPDLRQIRHEAAKYETTRVINTALDTLPAQDLNR